MQLIALELNLKGEEMLKLKCKIGSLAAEARFTRNIERKEKKEARRIAIKYPKGEVYPVAERMIRALDLRDHRVRSIRREARTAQLAYAFLRDRPYLLTERSLKTNAEGHCTNAPKWDAVEKMALRFTVDDPRDVKQRFAEWKDAKLSPEIVERLAVSDLHAKAVLAERRREDQARNEAS